MICVPVSIQNYDLWLMPLDYFNIFVLVNLMDQFSNPLCNFTPKYWLAVFGNLYYVIFQIVNGVTTFSIVLHTASILKSLSKEEGFLPFPEENINLNFNGNVSYYKIYVIISL